MTCPAMFLAFIVAQAMRVNEDIAQAIVEDAYRQEITLYQAEQDLFDLWLNGPGKPDVCSHYYNYLP